MFGIQPETSLLISCGRLSSLSTKKWGFLRPKAAPEQHKITTCIINHNQPLLIKQPIRIRQVIRRQPRGISVGTQGRQGKDLPYAVILLRTISVNFQVSGQSFTSGLVSVTEQEGYQYKVKGDISQGINQFYYCLGIEKALQSISYGYKVGIITKGQ